MTDHPPPFGHPLAEQGYRQLGNEKVAINELGNLPGADKKNPESQPKPEFGKSR
jgi:hypothetical protein